MKKTAIILISYFIFILPAFCEENKGLTPIDDILLKHRSMAELQEHKFKEIQPIVDNVADSAISRQGTTFVMEVSKSGSYQSDVIQDELLSDDFIASASNYVFAMPEAIDHEFIERTIDLTNVRIIKPKVRYDFTKKQIPINIKLAEKYSHKNNKLEGDTLSFEAQDDFEINGKKFSKGTVVYGRIETLSKSDKMGVPETLIVDNFYIDEEPDDIELSGQIFRSGANRSIWVYPLYQAGNIMFYVAGFVFVPIHGGHAKLSMDESFTVFYETK